MITLCINMYISLILVNKKKLVEKLYQMLLIVNKYLSKAVLYYIFKK